MAKSILLHVDVSKTARRVASSTDPDKKLHSVVSDLGLHCFLWPSVPIHSFNCCHAEYIKMPRPLLIFSHSDYLIQIVAINSNT